MPILSLLVVLLVACVVYWAATRLLAAFGVGDPIRTVVIVLLVVVLLVWVINVFLGGSALNFRLR